MLYKPPGAVYIASYKEPLDQSDCRKLSGSEIILKWDNDIPQKPNYHDANNVDDLHTSEHEGKELSYIQRRLM